MFLAVESSALAIAVALQCETQANAFGMIRSLACVALEFLNFYVALEMVNEQMVPFHFAPMTFWHRPQYLLKPALL